MVHDGQGQGFVNIRSYSHIMHSSDMIFLLTQILFSICHLSHLFYRWTANSFWVT